MFTDTVSVAGDSVIQPKHYGSLFTMADYTTKAHNLYATVSFLASPKLTFTGLLNYNISKGELEQVNMPAPSTEVESSLTHQDYTFEEMHEYSNLDYGYLRLGLGTEYRVASGTAITADIEYADLSDETGYVYGIESGSYFMIRSGVRIDF
jgi:hypothetical protein